MRIWFACVLAVAQLAAPVNLRLMERMPVIDNLVAYYPLDEATGDAVDVHASKTATETSGTIGSATGTVGNARDFENSDTACFTRTDSAFNFIGDFTVSVWFKPESLAAGSFGAAAASYLSGSAVEGNWWVAASDDSRVVFQHFANSGADTNGRRYTLSGKVSNGVWAHVVARHVAGVFTIWLNGVSEELAESNTGDGYENSGFSIGRGYPDYSPYAFDGLIDELGIWGRAISDADIAWLYNSGNGRSYADIVAEAGGGGGNPWYAYAQQ